VYDYSTCCTNCVLTRLVHQVRVYAFSAPTTRLRIWCTPEALTNQGGGAHQYINHIVCFNTRDSHHPNKHTILYVFRALGYDSIVPLSWYKQVEILVKYYFEIKHVKGSDNAKTNALSKKKTCKVVTKC